MKKFTSMASFFLMAVIVVAGLAACGQRKEYDTVADYVNSISSSDRNYKRERPEAELDIKITADGDKMIYTCTCENLERSDELAEKLELEQAQEDVTFQNIADEIQKHVDVETGYVVVRYVDRREELIYSKNYTSQ